MKPGAASTDFGRIAPAKTGTIRPPVLLDSHDVAMIDTRENDHVSGK
jgi:hypothetical protein